MVFALHALLTDKAQEFTVERLQSELGDYFANDRELVMEITEMPFNLGPSLHLEWRKSWGASLRCERGDRVKADCVEIKEILGPSAPYDVGTIDRRIYATFGSDENREYTDQIVTIMDYLVNIEGVIVFDPQQNNIMK